MSRRKHVTLGLKQEVELPSEYQRIVQIVGPRGGNIVEVSYPNGQQTLVMLPSKFNKKLWLKRGGYVIIDEGLSASNSSPALADTAAQPEQPAASSIQADSAAASSQAATSGNKITGTITSVLYDEHIKQLKKQGAWPIEYAQGRASTSGTPGPDCDEATGQQEAQEGADGAADSSGAEDSDSGLPALHKNTNRQVIVHYVSDDDSEDED